MPRGKRPQPRKVRIPVPTSRDVARHAGVSQSTVSRALAGHASVDDALRERVLAAAGELGYRPNEAARAMRTSRSGNVGVVTARLANPLYPELLQVLSRELSGAGMRMVVWDTDDADGGAAVDAARSGGVDGVIFTTATSGSTRLYRAVTERVPVALVNRTVAGWPCDQVESDNRAGGAAVAAYFAAAGRRRIGRREHDPRPRRGLPGGTVGRWPRPRTGAVRAGRGLLLPERVRGGDTA